MVNLTFAVDAKTREYSEIYSFVAGPNATDADRQAIAQAIDWDIARRAARRQLQRQGINREPTEREISAIFYNM